MSDFAETKKQLKAELDLNAEAWAHRRDLQRSIQSELFSAMTLAGPLTVDDGRVVCAGERKFEFEARLARWNVSKLSKGFTLAAEVLHFIRASDRVKAMMPPLTAE